MQVGDNFSTYRVLIGLPCIKSLTQGARPVLSVNIKQYARGFLGGPGVQNPLPNAWDMGLIPGWETKIPHALGQ